MGWFSELARRVQRGGYAQHAWHSGEDLKRLARGRRIQLLRVDRVMCADCMVPAHAPSIWSTGYVHFPDCDAEDSQIRFLLKGGQLL